MITRRSQQTRNTEAIQDAEVHASLDQLGLELGYFRRTDFGAPIDLPTRIESTPDTASVKGMFFEKLAVLARGRGLECRTRYTPFRDYPMREYMQLLVNYSQARYPNLPAREGLRRTGWEAFPALMESIAGRVLFAVAGRDLLTALKVTPKAYEHTIRPGTVMMHRCSSRSAVLQLRDVWTFADCYHVGAVEGGARVFEPAARVEAYVRSPRDVHLLVRW